MARKELFSDDEILTGAEEIFLSSGLVHVEMKDLAAELGISRSTLYRHFPGKLDLAFPLTEKYILMLNDIGEISAEGKNASPADGATRFKKGIDAFITRLIRHPKEVAFITSFDILYHSGSVLTERARAYDRFIAGYRSPLHQLYQEGLRDGSLPPDDNAEETVYIFQNMCLGIAGRMVPREEVYLREHTFGTEIIYKAADLMFAGLYKDHVC